jgi:hypothetical protein
MRDTSAEAAAVQIAAFRRLSPAERVAMAFEASDWLLRIGRARPAAPASPPTVEDESRAVPSRPTPDDGV